jgi:hypothetical protein
MPARRKNAFILRRNRRLIVMDGPASAGYRAQQTILRCVAGSHPAMKRSLALIGEML